MQQQHNIFSSFIKILIGIGLAVLIFMSYMLAEQQGWVNTNIAGRILRGVEDGKAIRESRNAQEANAPANKEASDRKIFGDVNNAPAKQAEPAKQTPPAQPEKADDTAEKNDDESFGDEDTSDDTSSSEETPDTTTDKPSETPAAKPARPKKIDYAEVSRKRSTWPKAVQMRVKGTKVPMLDKNGNKIGEIEVPVGTRLFVLNVSERGILEVKSAVNGQTFQVHASRTTFSRLYTGKPISDGLVASGGSSGSSASTASDKSDTTSDDGDSDSSSDDDFSDDDFFDDDF